MAALPTFPQNPLCKLFGIRYPVVQAGMVWCSGPELATAVSGAGGLGLLGAASMRPDDLRAAIRQVRATTEAPFGVNVPLFNKYTEDHLQIIMEEGVPIVFTSAGNPKTYTAQLKAAGCTVVHVVPSARFAQKAQAAGCDAVVCEGFEAGGHNGADELTTFTLIPLVRAAVQVPVIAAGGIGTGAGMVAAMALGADGVQIGSRFAATQESSAHPAFKDAIVQAGEDATRLMMKKLVPVRLLKNAFYEQVAALEAEGATREQLAQLLGTGRSRIGMWEGNLQDGELEIGQVAALIDDLPPAAELLHRLLQDYADTLAATQQGGKWGALT